MAMYRHEQSIIGRSANRSAVACAAYRHGTRLKDERYGKEHDYTNKGGVLYSQIMLPENAPDRLRDRALLWNEVERVEKRKDATLAREALLALPPELTDDQRQQLVCTYVREQFVDRGMIADIAIHEPHPKSDERNYHAHVMLTMRAVDSDGFGKKERSWNDKSLLYEARENWGTHVNKALENAHRPERVDHRRVEVQRKEQEQIAQQALAKGDQEAAEKAQVKAQRLDYVPEPKVGHTAMAMERKAGLVAGREDEHVRGKNHKTTAMGVMAMARWSRRRANSLANGMEQQFAKAKQWVQEKSDQVSGAVQKGAELASEKTRQAADQLSELSQALASGLAGKDLSHLSDDRAVRQKGYDRYNAETERRREEAEQKRQAEIERQKQEELARQERERKRGLEIDWGMEM